MLNSLMELGFYVNKYFSIKNNFEERSLFKKSLHVNVMVMNVFPTVKYKVVEDCRLMLRADTFSPVQKHKKGNIHRFIVFVLVHKRFQSVP